MSPTISPCPQVRRAATTVRRQRGQDLDDFELGQCRPYDHFTGKFHARGAKGQFYIRSRRNPRMPQWKSPMLAPKNNRPRNDRIGLPR